MWAMTMGTGAFNWTLSVVMGWMTFDLTRSALLTSLALAMSSVPFLVIGPLAGVLVDRWDRRHVLVSAIAAKAVITAVFAAIVMAGYLQTWHIFAFLLLIGTAIVLVHPAMLSLVSNIVPKEMLVNAYALNSMGFNLIRLLVPALAGVSIVLLGAAETLFLGVAALLASALAVRAVKLEPGQNERRVERHNPLAQVAEAVRYVKNERVVLSLIALGIVPGVLLLPFVHGLMPVYAGEVFNVGPAGLGILISAPGIGSLLGSIMLASARALPRGRVIVLALVWAVICAASFSLSRSMGMSLVLLMMLSSGLANLLHRQRSDGPADGPRLAEGPRGFAGRYGPWPLSHRRPRGRHDRGAVRRADGHSGRRWSDGCHSRHLIRADQEGLEPQVTPWPPAIERPCRPPIGWRSPCSAPG